MTLALYAHPLSSYCWKVLAALYENGTPFEYRMLDPEHPQNFGEMLALWPPGKFPLLTDGERAIPESTIIIDYLDAHYPGPVRLIPDDPDAARQVRLADRFYDLHVHNQMQRIVNNWIRPTDDRDPTSDREAREKLDLAYDMIEADMKTKTWAAGETFSLADCAAGPALFYADFQHPLGDARPNAKAYLERLKARPGLKRAMAEAQPFMHMVPRG
jgi:glutathione S-transferase